MNFEEFLSYTVKIADYKNKEEVIEHFKDLAISKEQREAVMNIAKRFMLEGEARGEARGVRKTEIKIARDMLNAGYPYDIINKFIKIPIEELEESEDLESKNLE